MAGKNSRSSKTAHVLNLLSGGTPEVKPDAVPPPGKHLPRPLEPAPLLQTCPCRRLRPLLRAVSPRPFWRWPAATMLRCQRASTLRWNPHFRRSWPPRSRLPPPLRSLLHLPLPAAEGEASPQVLDTPPPTPSAPAPSAPAPSPSVPEQASTELSDGAELFNVMQLLVAEKLERYVKLFGLCSCPRCLADAEALALTRLPAQYAVFPPDLLPTKLSVYRARYDSEITRQIIWACKSVMDSPRHILPAGSR